MPRVEYTKETTLEKALAGMYQHMLDAENEGGNPECEVSINDNEIEIKCNMDVDYDKYGWQVIDFGDYTGTWHSKGYGSKRSE